MYPYLFVPKVPADKTPRSFEQSHSPPNSLVSPPKVNHRGSEDEKSALAPVYRDSGVCDVVGLGNSVADDSCLNDKRDPREAKWPDDLSIN